MTLACGRPISSSRRSNFVVALQPAAEVDREGRNALVGVLAMLMNPPLMTMLQKGLY